VRSPRTNAGQHGDPDEIPLPGRAATSEPAASRRINSLEAPFI
jgi:hypothetical protein